MPLQRHPALVPLSRDHHHALLLARGVQRGTPPNLRSDLPASRPERAAHVVRVFRGELEGHFQAEELMLLPAIRGRDIALDALCTEILHEHAQLRTLVETLAGEPGEETVDRTLDEFGKLLEAHVRKEERALYPRIQEALSDDELTRLGKEMESHMQATCPTRKTSG